MKHNPFSLSCEINLYIYVFSGDKIKNNELGGLCKLYEGEVRCIKDSGRETRGKEYIWKT